VQELGRDGEAPVQEAPLPLGFLIPECVLCVVPSGAPCVFDQAVLSPERLGTLGVFSRCRCARRSLFTSGDLMS